MSLARQWFYLFVFVGMLRAYPARAADSPQQADLIQALLARIDTLEKRVAELERKGAPPAVAAAPAPAPEAQARAKAMTEGLPGEAHGLPGAPSLKLGGFGDINFASTDQRGARQGFFQGQFTLHISSALSPRVNYFGEVTLSARSDAGTGSPPATGFNAEVERSIIRFEQSDYLKFSGGRYHTPINWWNTAFHHGQWLQTTISRPEMTQFGGRFIPVHFLGGLVEGAFPAGGLNLNYNVGLGNGRGSVISRGGDDGDNNFHRAWLVNLFAKPDRLFGMQVGGSVYRDKVAVAGGREFREWITSAHVVWQKEDPEIIAEFANVHHEEIGRPGTFNSQAWYVQAAYRLPWFEKLWKPYYRFEYIHIPRGDTVFRGVPNLVGSTAGIRYDIAAFAALKLEYRNQRRPGIPRVNGAFLQTSFTF